MGKHERELARQLEQSVVARVNGGAGRLPSSHVWAGYDVAFEQAIRTDFGEGVTAIHSGNDYSVLGDVQLKRGPTHVASVELKASLSEAGRGTEANITQDALTLYGLFVGKELDSWSSFRARRGFDRTVMGILRRHPAAARLGRKEEMGRTIRLLASKGDTLAATLKAEVVRGATRDKLEYLEYLRRNGTLNPPAVRVFCWAMLTGRHRKPEVEALLREAPTRLREAARSPFVTYYANKGEDRAVVTRKNHEHIQSLFSSTVGFRLVIPDPSEETVTCRISARGEGRDLELLRLVLNWKNVFQGIQTPCINVFLGEAL